MKEDVPNAGEYRPFLIGLLRAEGSWEPVGPDEGQQTGDRSNVGVAFADSLFVMFVNESALVPTARPSMLQCCISSVSRRFGSGSTPSAITKL